MKAVTLSEFRRLTGVSDSALVWLLENKKLVCQLDKERGILVDLDSAQLKELIQSISTKKNKALSDQASLISERFARIISDNFEAIAEEALARLKQ